MEFIAWQKLVQLIYLLSDILYYLYKQDNKFVATLVKDKESVELNKDRGGKTLQKLL